MEDWAFFLLTCYLPVTAGLWAVFAKAGERGWMALVPWLNMYVVTRIVGRSPFWVLLLLVPYLGILVALFLLYELALAFGKGGGFTLGMVLLPMVFVPMLGFGGSHYKRPLAAKVRASRPRRPERGSAPTSVPGSGPGSFSAGTQR